MATPSLERTVPDETLDEDPDEKPDEDLDEVSMQSWERLPELHLNRLVPDELLIISPGERWQWYGRLPPWQPFASNPPE
ncbi:hypothetical protein GCM10025772_18410 [Ferrimonas gelatinilytica]|uniref:Uncharacterized protein n=1 Tax=Ferrimonas gelatinilytica TaxID=1255257 RepID=A0ABP9S7W1_9GAMM